MTKQCCFIFLINFLTALLALGQDQPSLTDNNSLVSDLKSLEEHIKENMIYPEDARYKGIHGIVYVHFKIDHSGMLLKNEVKTFFGLFPSCDREAERVIKLYNKRWTVDPNGIMEQSFIVPIKFVLTDDGALDFPSHTLNNPVKTIVLPKSISTKNPMWSVYGKKGLKNSIGRISPGDTVTVTGWASWCYFIQAKDVVGYVSHHALQINSQMGAVAKIVEEQSATEEAVEEQMKEAHPIDTVRNFSSETLHFSVTTSKKSIFVGECTTLTLAFNVREDNQLKVQFHDLGMQVLKILTTKLNVFDAFVISNDINNVEGEKSTINNQKYVTYKVYQGAFCPNREQSLRIPSLKLKMLVWKMKDKEDEKIAEFNSTPVAINVKPLPPITLTTYNRYRMVGNFTMEEKIVEKNVSVGKPFTYQITVKGEGLVFPVEPPKLNNLDLEAELRDVQNNDTIINDVLYSDKTFIYQIIPRTEGVHDLNKIINFSFFNPTTTKKQTVTSSLKISAEKGEDTGHLPSKNERYDSRNNFIAIDASQSMLIEDYLPNRLSVVKEGLKNFLQKRTRATSGSSPLRGMHTT